MECAICYEKFLNVNSEEEYLIKCNNFITALKLTDCNTEHCNSKICDSCWIKITEREYRGPFCRKINEKRLF